MSALLSASVMSESLAGDLLEFASECNAFLNNGGLGSRIVLVILVGYVFLAVFHSCHKLYFRRMRHYCDGSDGLTYVCAVGAGIICFWAVVVHNTTVEAALIRQFSDPEQNYLLDICFIGVASCCVVLFRHADDVAVGTHDKTIPLPNPESKEVHRYKWPHPEYSRHTWHRPVMIRNSKDPFLDIDTLLSVEREKYRLSKDSVDSSVSSSSFGSYSTSENFSSLGKAADERTSSRRYLTKQDLKQGDFPKLTKGKSLPHVRSSRKRHSQYNRQRGKRKSSHIGCNQDATDSIIESLKKVKKLIVEKHGHASGDHKNQGVPYKLVQPSTPTLTLSSDNNFSAASEKFKVFVKTGDVAVAKKLSINKTNTKGTNKNKKKDLGSSEEFKQGVVVENIELNKVEEFKEKPTVDKHKQVDENLTRDALKVEEIKWTPTTELQNKQSSVAYAPSEAYERMDPVPVGKEMVASKTEGHVARLLQKYAREGKIHLSRPVGSHNVQQGDTTSGVGLPGVPNQKQANHEVHEQQNNYVSDGIPNNMVYNTDGKPIHINLSYYTGNTHGNQETTGAIPTNCLNGLQAIDRKEIDNDHDNTNRHEQKVGDNVQKHCVETNYEKSKPLRKQTVMLTSNSNSPSEAASCVPLKECDPNDKACSTGSAIEQIIIERELQKIINAGSQGIESNPSPLGDVAYLLERLRRLGPGNKFESELNKIIHHIDETKISLGKDGTRNGRVKNQSRKKLKQKKPVKQRSLDCSPSKHEKLGGEQKLPATFTRSQIKRTQRYKTKNLSSDYGGSANSKGSPTAKKGRRERRASTNGSLLTELTKCLDNKLTCGPVVSDKGPTVVSEGTGAKRKAKKKLEPKNGQKSELVIECIPMGSNGKSNETPNSKKRKSRRLKNASRQDRTSFHTDKCQKIHSLQGDKYVTVIGNCPTMSHKE